MKRFLGVMTVLASGILAGCVGIQSPLSADRNHPANSQAEQAPLEAAIAVLMAGAHGLMPAPASTNQMEMQHEHGGHQPGGKPAQAPAGHQHEDHKK